MSSLPNKFKGFTLIEIIIVIVIMGVILSFASLSINTGGLDAKLAQEAKRFASLLKLASQEAIFQSKEMGVSFEKNSYQFYVYEQNWQAVTAHDDIFHPRTLPVGVKISFEIENVPVVMKTTNIPQLLLLSSGELTPFEVIFMPEIEDDNTIPYKVTGSAIGIIKIVRPNEDE